MDLFSVADNLVALRDRKKELEEELKDVNTQIAEIEKTLVDKMIEEEMQNFTRNGRQFILTSRLYVSAKAGMMENICAWMKQHGLEDMVKEHVHPQTLQAWCKETVEETGTLPEELESMLNVYEKSGISIRNKK